MFHYDAYPNLNTSQSDADVFVLSVSKIDVEVLDIELLLSHIFKVGLRLI